MTDEDVLKTVCPSCNAAINGRCLEKRKDVSQGMYYTVSFHKERLDATRERIGFPSKKLRVYISGPITGMPNLNIEQFSTMERILKEKGFDVINPHNLNTQDKKWEECMKVDIIELMKCDAICMLPNWQKSKGANIEYSLALNVGLRVIE